MIPLEDQITDVVGKARRGQRLSEAQLAQQAGVSLEDVEAFAAGKFTDENKFARLAGALKLHAPALVALGVWHPGAVALPATAAAYNVPFGDDMTVNFYLAWDRDGGHAAAFDTGSDCNALLATLHEKKLRLDAIFLTHTHPDHIADLDRLTAETDAPVYVSAAESLDGAATIGIGDQFTVGGLTITARSTPGHSPGGLTFVITGLDKPIAVVGDALFAGSMGGVSPANYPDALRANSENILTLPDETIIFPGHGPVTTVGLEKRHNPFYAA